MIANKFSVVTTLARSVPALEHNLHRYGLMARCARVRSSEVAVLELEQPGSNARARISAEIHRAIEEDRAEAIVLGCAATGRRYCGFLIRLRGFATQSTRRQRTN